MITQYIKNVPAELKNRWNEVCEMPKHERNQLLICMALAFGIVYGLVAVL